MYQLITYIFHPLSILVCKETECKNFELNFPFLTFHTEVYKGSLYAVLEA